MKTFAYSTLFSGWTFDFVSATTVPFRTSFGTSNVSGSGNVAPQLGDVVDTEFTGWGAVYKGSFAVHRVGTVTPIGSGFYTYNYVETVDLSNSSVSSVAPGFFGDGFKIDLGGLVAYDTVSGLAVGALIADGDKIDGTGYADSLKTTDKAELIDLKGGDNTVEARGGNDTVLASTGKDTIDGGTGDDSMEGGAGDDLYTVDSSLDVIVEALNGGFDRVLSSASFVMGDNVEDLVLGGGGDIGGTGNDLGNYIKGNAGANSITGGGGRDTIDGGIGADTMAGGFGDDTFKVDAATDVVTETSTGGYDTVASTSNYVLGAHIEKLTLTGAAVKGTGNSSANTIVGSALGNELKGMAGADTISGGGGVDKIAGGAGKDRLTGGALKDSFVFATVAETGPASAKRDVITDFKHGLDKIDLSGIDARKGFKPNDKFIYEGTDKFSKTAGELHWFKEGSGSAKRTIIEGDIDGNGKADFQIELSGHISLTKVDFIL